MSLLLSEKYIYYFIYRMNLTSIKTVSVFIIQIILLIFFGSIFLKQQSVWVDESTQLTGLAMNPADCIHWLAGKPMNLLVPDDRMPPLSYMVGWIWSQAFGLTENSMRFFGLSCATIGLIFTFLAAKRIGGNIAGLAASLFLATSPNIITIAVEIRAYPLFFLLSSTVVFSIVHALASQTEKQYNRWIILTAFLLMLCCYTHYFGVILTLASLGILFVESHIRRRPMTILVVITILGAISLAGLIPFIRSAYRVSGDGEVEATGFKPFISLFLRLITHPAVGVKPTLVAIAMLGALFGLILSLWQSQNRKTVWMIFGIGGLALLLLFIGSVVVKKFNVASSSYNIYLAPIIAVVLGMGLTGPKSKIAAIGMTMILLANAYGAYNLSRNGEVFSHGPQDRIVAIIDRLGAQHTALIYETPTSDAFHISFPVRWYYDDEVLQLDANSNGDKWVRKHPSDRPETMIQDYKYLLIIRSKHCQTRELSRFLSKTHPGFQDKPTTLNLVQSGDWVKVDHYLFPGFNSADVDVLENVRK